MTYRNWIRRGLGAIGGQGPVRIRLMQRPGSWPGSWLPQALRGPVPNALRVTAETWRTHGIDAP